MQLAGTRLQHHPSRAGLTKPSKAGPVWTGEVRFNEQWLDQPLRWSRPRRVFVCAHGDLFHEGVPDEWIDRIFAVMALAPQHTFQVLTKRPERMQRYLQDTRSCGPGNGVFTRVAQAADALGHEIVPAALRQRWPLPNVWLGVSVENQATADERIPLLLDTPAAVRWISAEPLLGSIELETAWHGVDALRSDCWGECAWCSEGLPPLHNCQKGRQSEAEWRKGRSGLDWVVAGGESGPGARPMHPDWARSLRDQCTAAGVPFHFKQWGEWAPCPDDAWHGLGPVGKPKQMVIGRDGSTAGGFLSEDLARRREAEGWVPISRVGKHAAGRELDGRTWDQYPDREAGHDPPHRHRP